MKKSLGASLLLLAAGPASADVADVWAVNDGEKVLRDDLANPNRKGNSAWDGKTISLFSARNEIVSFQVIVQSGGAGARAVDVRLPSLRPRGGGAALSWRPPGADVTDWRDRPLERFTQHYVEIRRRTPPGWFYDRNAAPAPLTGGVPDALVPETARPGRGGLPIDIGPSRNQGFWFDVHVPRDFPAGTCEGTLAVLEEGKKIREIPVTLRVHDFTLPDENHFLSMICFDGDLGARHPNADPALLAAYHRLARRHRVEFTHAYRAPPPKDQLDRITGEAFTPTRGYAGPGEGAGYRIVPASFYGAPPKWRGEGGWKEADRFMEWLSGVRKDAVTFLYLEDEPPPRRFPEIAALGHHHHANPGPGRKLPMLLTKWPHAALEGAIDIWCTPTSHCNLEKRKEELGKGRKWWVYNGHRPYAGTQITDAPAVDPRVTMWACWKYGVDLWFYWLADHWRHNQQHAERGHQNVWADPVTFGGEGGINGDGVLVYPGEDLKHPGEDRGVRGPVASIRLKNIRRGMQDYEYLWLAAKNGMADRAKAIADRAVPAAFSEAKGRVSWSERGSDWDAYRQELAKILDGKARPPR